MPIDSDTPILPFIVADGVVSQLAAYLGQELPAGYAERLTVEADRIYAANPRFRKTIRADGNKGRDALYAFMRHWLSACIAKDDPALFRRLPTGFTTGA